MIAMPGINWDAFGQLPESPEKNFEKLCRVLIWRHYAQFGEFRALAAQPGVEFHLRLKQPCPLGDPERWFGWQCKWYSLGSGAALGAPRKEKIKEALQKTKQHVPGITDWILWTRFPLTKGDQEWFYGLETGMTLHAWTSAEAEGLLAGPAEIYRRTYFGELVLTPESLKTIHDQAVAPILLRWNPAVHQVIDAERRVRQLLGEPSSWKHLSELSALISEEANRLEDFSEQVPPFLTDDLLALTRKARGFSQNLSDTFNALMTADLDALQLQFRLRPSIPDPATSAVPRRLRSLRHPAALLATNLLSDCRRAESRLALVEKASNVRTLAIVADAGCGKTEFSAQITSASNERPAGVLLHGRMLGASKTLDDLAKTITIQGYPVASMEALLAALDSAGRRSNRRLPLVIDGLNEAEDARNWKPLLAQADKVAKHFPYVLLVCTLRKAFVEDALPPDWLQVEIPDFEHDAKEAIERYFSYYRIDARDATLSGGLLRHPLTLRLFCEVTNPQRDRFVGIEAMPGSLTALFDRYLKQAIERIIQLSSREWRYYGPDIRVALEKTGSYLWDQRTRALDFGWLRLQLNDDRQPWDRSLLRALEEEGVLIRVREHGALGDFAAFVYDRLAGHVIATSLLSRVQRNGMAGWLGDPTNVALLAGSYSEQHPLGEDTLQALVGLFPRTFGEQLWPLLVEGHAQSTALLSAAELEDTYLDARTVAALSQLLRESNGGHKKLCNRLLSTRGSANHPLNSNLLDEVLRGLSVAQRDSGWTEWIRANGEDVVRDLEQLENGWRAAEKSTEGDYLRAQWIMWVLCSTSKTIRDQATRALYWFGRLDPAGLFRLAIASLTINDAYVHERTLAASYGVVMAHQLVDAAFGLKLRDFLVELRDAFVGVSASSPTNHWLERIYIQGCVTFALRYYPDAIPEGLHINGRVGFAAGPQMQDISDSDPRALELNDALTGYYGNGTLDDFIGFGRHYGRSGELHNEARQHLRAHLAAACWSESRIKEVDKQINTDSYTSRNLSVHRYVEKYTWIGLSTFARMEEYYDTAYFNHRPADVHIDPSFPSRVPKASFQLKAWASTEPSDDSEWMRHGEVLVPDALFYLDSAEVPPGPWMLVQGYLRSEHLRTERGVWGRVGAVLVSAEDVERLVRAMRGHAGKRWFPDVPEDHYTFAGEIPWSPEYARGLESQEGARMYEESFAVTGGAPINVESLSHTFSWESYHSSLNQAGGALLPSKRFSRQFGLRGVPQSFDQVLPDGSLASLSFEAPGDFSGHLLYLREDLLAQYAGERKLVWFALGERTLDRSPHARVPDWLEKLYRTQGMSWSRVTVAEELSTAFRIPGTSTGPKQKRPKRRTK
jgi:hypothetical protein